MVNTNGKSQEEWEMHLIQFASGKDNVDTDIANDDIHLFVLKRHEAMASLINSIIS